MHREKNAFKLYNRLAEISESTEHKEMFLMLASQEAKHKLRLEMIYDDDILIEN
jgi:rubrerythrin